MSQQELDQAAGAKLKELRQKAGQSQEEVSFTAGVDQSTLSKIERLGPTAIGWGRFCRIAETLGFNVEIVFLRPGGQLALGRIQDTQIAKKTRESDQVRLNALWISILQTLRHDELHSSLIHFPELAFRDAFLKGQEMFFLDPVSFVRDLSPSVFASRLRGKHPKPISREIFALIRGC